MLKNGPISPLSSMGACSTTSQLRRSEQYGHNYIFRTDYGIFVTQLPYSVIVIESIRANFQGGCP